MEVVGGPSSEGHNDGHDLSYSDPKNRFMKGKNLLVRQIVAQQTKVKAWEIVGTKISILSFAMPKYITLGFVFNLIPILQSGHLDESVFLLTSIAGAAPPFHRLNLKYYTMMS